MLDPKGLVFTPLPYEIYTSYKREAKTISPIAVDAELDVAVILGAMPQPALAHMVTGSYFAVLGTPAGVGRTLVAADDRGDGTPVVVSHGFWERHFGASHSAIGRTVFVDGEPFIVVGVMLPGFFGASLDSPADLWIPLASEKRISTVPLESSNSDRSFDILGRLKAGVTLPQAQAEFRTALAIMITSRPDLGAWFWRGTVEPIARRATWTHDKLSRFLLLLLGAVGLTFAILCSNVAGLFLARAARRQRETALRISLGATRLQLLTERVQETWPLAVLGAAVGIVLGSAAGPLLLRFVPVGQAPLPISLRPNLSVIGISAAIAVGVSIVFGSAAAWLPSQMNLFLALRGGASGTRLGALSRGLVLAQIGLATALVFGAGLLGRTLSRLAAADPGFNRDHVAVFTLDTAMGGLQALPAHFPDRLLDSVRSLQGVRDAALASMELMQGRGFVISVAPAGSRLQTEVFMNTSVNAVSPSYFKTLGIPLFLGRRLSAQDDRRKNPTPVVVSAAFARFLFPHEPPLGRLFGHGKLGDTAKADYEIVGIIGDAKYRSMRESPPPTFYMPLTQRLDSNASFVLYVRTAGPPNQIVAAVRSALFGIDPQLPFAKVETMSGLLAHSVWQERLLAFLTSILGGLALLLSATAIYGVLAFEVSRRTREIAIRLAVGAETKDVASLVARSIGFTVLLGLAAGLLACFGLGHLLQT